MATRPEICVVVTYPDGEDIEFGTSGLHEDRRYCKTWSAAYKPRIERRYPDGRVEIVK